MNKLKEKLYNEQTAMGGWCVLDHSGVAQLLAQAGFDFVVLDAEHGVFDRGSIRSCIAEIERAGAVPVVRLESCGDVPIKLALDAGARGIIVPMVNTPEDAASVVRWARMPPQGERGIGCGRASDYGCHLAEYVQSINDDLFIAVQIEHRRAVENVEAIAAVEGIDALFIGPVDLAGSYGLRMELDNAQVQQAIMRVCKVSQKQGRHLGMWCPHLDAAKQARERGIKMICVGADAMLLFRGAQEILQAWRISG